jgi:hypothetical protein
MHTLMIVVGILVAALVLIALVALVPDFVRYMKIRSM